MSRARHHIERAANRRNLTVKSMTWEPWYNAGEMQGIAGGWTVEFDEVGADLARGLSWQEVVKDIESGWVDRNLAQRINT